ncbi:MAG: hypothetical protein WCX13_01360, partial [Candidatus Hydrogenedentales bacterium]
MIKYERLEEIINVSKGKKHKPVDIPNASSKRIIGIADLRDDRNCIFTNDEFGIEAHERDILIALDGANAGTIGYSKSGYIG